ncbi:MAG TPA: antibiotic resistance protein VanZ [Acidobacteria bacterium]|nr:antibiotic resistance protein VanZ [Acidobacteriota bacterium]
MRTVRRERLRRALPALLLMAAIFALSQMSLPVGATGGSDKIIHALVFGLLAGLWMRALDGWEGGLASRALLAICVTTAWGVLDEIHQAFVPGRTASALDALADLAGAVVVVGWLTWRASGRAAGPAEG